MNINPDVAINIRMALAQKFADGVSTEYLTKLYDWVIEPLKQTNIIPVKSFEVQK